MGRLLVELPTPFRSFSPFSYIYFFLSKSSFVILVYTRFPLSDSFSLDLFLFCFLPLLFFPVISHALPLDFPSFSLPFLSPI